MATESTATPVKLRRTIAELGVELEKRTTRRDKRWLRTVNFVMEMTGRDVPPGAEYASLSFRIAPRRRRRSIEKAGISL
jgi:hypothetical protein